MAPWTFLKKKFPISTFLGVYDTDESDTTIFLHMQILYLSAKMQPFIGQININKSRHTEFFSFTTLDTVGLEVL